MKQETLFPVTLTLSNLTWQNIKVMAGNMARNSTQKG